MAIKFFLTKKEPRHEKPIPGETTVRLRHTAWDDFHYRTTFSVAVSVSGEPYESVGEWKILNSAKADKSTVLPSQFDQLDEHYCSLAQNVSNYEKLAKLGLIAARAVLHGLRDISLTKARSRILELKAFQTSVIRFPTARDALQRGQSVLAALRIIERATPHAVETPIAFEFSCRRPGASGRMTHEVAIAFEREPLGLHRLWCLVGNNGAGKTLILSALARCLSGLEGDGTRVQPTPTFRKVIAVSYSPWDTFTTPSGEGDKIPYIYCGLRTQANEQGTELDIPKARNMAVHDLQHIRGDEAVFRRWVQAVKACGLDRANSPVQLAARGQGTLESLELCSAGEQLATIVITRLIRHVERDSLVLFDEPELHMHPELLSGLLRTLHELLLERDAFAIIGTHSPIPLQEIPSQCVAVLDLMESTTYTHLLDEQCFGTNLGAIVANAFRVRQDSLNWARFIRQAVKNHPREKILAALGDDPGSGVEMLLAALAVGAEDNEAV